MDTDSELSDSWWKRVKYYPQLAIEQFEFGVESVKELHCFELEMIHS
ncbi:hypothetical protein [Nostoc sp.]